MQNPCGFLGETVAARIEPGDGHSLSCWFSDLSRDGVRLRGDHSGRLSKTVDTFAQTRRLVRVTWTGSNCVGVVTGRYTAVHKTSARAVTSGFYKQNQLLDMLSPLSTHCGPATLRNHLILVQFDGLAPVIQTRLIGKGDQMAGLHEHFADTLKDIYYAEKQIYKALPKMIRKASNAELKAGFESHREETQGQIERLDQIFEMMGLPARGKKCPAIDGILEEASELIEEHEKGAGLDAAMAAAAQAVEHYEIARYGTLCSWAEILGHSDVHKLLGETLEQEEACDKTLSQLALGTLNGAAIEGEQNDESDDAKKAGKSGSKAKSSLGGSKIYGKASDDEDKVGSMKSKK